MSITADCPECQSRFFLEPGLVGKKMRCPTCKAVFTVEPFAVPEEGGSPKSKVRKQPAAIRPEPERRPEPARPQPSVEEFVWSEDSPLLPPPGGVPSASEGHSAPALLLALPTAVAAAPAKRSLSRTSGLVLLVMVLFLAAGGIYGFMWLSRYRAQAPDRLWAAATEDYRKKNFESARLRFEEFGRSYPASPRSAEARFLADLAALRGQVDSTFTRADPKPALDGLRAFLAKCEERDYRPFAAKDRFGVDIWQSAARLLEDLVGHAGDLVKPDTFPAAKAELAAVADLQKRVSELQPLGSRTDLALGESIASLGKRLADLENRQVYLTAWQSRLAKLDDTAIREVREAAVAHRLEGDADVRRLLGDAEAVLQKVFVYRANPDPVPATAEGDIQPSGLVFAVAVAEAADRRKLPGPKRVHAALWRGMLYGLDTAGGELVWCRPCGDARVYPLPGDSPAGDRLLTVVRGPTETVLSLRETPTGNLLWRRGLPAAPIGAPVRYGAKLLVAGRSGPESSIDEIDIRTGAVLGTMALGPTADGALLADPAAARVYWVVDARSAYAFAWPVGVESAEKPRLIEAVPLDPADTGTGTRSRLWAGIPSRSPVALRWQPRGEGVNALRWLRLAADRAEQAGDTAPLIRGEPVTDGDRIAYVGADGALQIRQLTADAEGRETLAPVGHFDLAKEVGTGPHETAWLRFGETDAIYFRDGSLRQVRFGFRRIGGVVHTNAVLLGDLGQLESAPAVDGNLALLQTRTDSETGLVTAVDLSDGRILWKRQLGSRIAEIANGADASWLFDRSGRVIRIGAETTGAPLSVQSSSAADAIAGLRAPPVVRETPAGYFQVGWAERAGETFLIQRSFEHRNFGPGGNRSYTQTALKLPARPVAAPLILDRETVLALTDGRLYRVGRGDNLWLEPGPNWRTEASGNGVPLLRAAGGDRFIATDGGRTVAVWRSGDFEPVGRLSLPDLPVDLAGGDGDSLVALGADGDLVAVPVGQPDARVLLGRAEPERAVWSAAARLQPYRAGTRSGWLVVRTDKIDVIPTGKDAPRWKLLLPEGDALAGSTTVEPAGFLTVTLTSGRIRRYALSDGSQVGDRAIDAPGAKPSGSAVSLPSGQGWLVPMTDGTVRIAKSEDLP